MPDSIPWMPEKAWTTARAYCAIAGLTRCGFTPDFVQVDPPCELPYACPDPPAFVPIWEGQFDAYEGQLCLEALDDGGVWPGATWFRWFDSNDAILGEGATMLDACFEVTCPEHEAGINGTYIHVYYDGNPYEGAECYVEDRTLPDINVDCCDVELTVLGDASVDLPGSSTLDVAAADLVTFKAGTIVWWEFEMDGHVMADGPDESLVTQTVNCDDFNDGRKNYTIRAYGTFPGDECVVERSGLITVLDPTFGCGV